jgi:hypothetical protein
MLDSLSDRGSPRSLPRGVLRPSAAYALPARTVRGYVASSDDPPSVGDVIVGQVRSIGAHREIENPQGRIHQLNEGFLSLFVYGNRYATDAFEAVVPERSFPVIDLVARSGVVGEVHSRNSRMLAPTQVAVLGRAVDADGRPINSLQHPRIVPKKTEKSRPRSQMILVVGTSMNSGKSTVAAALCWALTTMGHNVRASKVTGTASLREILQMSDAGARTVSDFSYLGYPSTHLLDESDLLHIFDTLDLKSANNPRNHWIVEVADGVLQRETAMLLGNPSVRERVDRLILCAADSFGALGAIRTLADIYGLVPDAVSGLIANSPLGVRELTDNAAVATFNAAKPDLRAISAIILAGDGP